MNIKTFPDTILLAAGLGTRMLPLTETMPKPLLRVANTPLLERVVDNFRTEGARNFVINTHYLPELVEEKARVMADEKPECTFGISPEKEALLETGGGAKKALRLTQSDPVFVANTDAFWAGDDQPLTRMQRHFEAIIEKHSDAIMLLCAHPAKSLGFRRSHDFCLNPLGQITNDSGVPVIYAGVALMSRRAFARTPEEIFSLNILLERAQENKSLFGVLLNADWYHVGDPEALDATEKRLRAEG